MEFKYLAQQQLELYGTIYLLIFCVSFIVFLALLCLSDVKKQNISARIAKYVSLFIAFFSFGCALYLSDYNAYSSKFTEEIYKMINVVSAAMLGGIALVVVGAVIAVLRKRK